MAARVGECRIVRCKRRLEQTITGNREPEGAHGAHAVKENMFQMPPNVYVLRQETYLGVINREGRRERCGSG